MKHFVFAPIALVALCFGSLACNTEQLQPEAPVPEYCLYSEFDYSGFNRYDSLMHEAAAVGSMSPELENFYQAIAELVSEADSALLVNAEPLAMFEEMAMRVQISPEDSARLANGDVSHVEAILQRITSLPESFAPFSDLTQGIMQLDEIQPFLPQSVEVVRLCAVAPVGPLEERYSAYHDRRRIEGNMLLCAIDGPLLAQSLQTCIFACNFARTACIAIALAVYVSAINALVAQLAAQLAFCAALFLPVFQAICAAGAIAWFAIVSDAAALTLAGAINTCNTKADACIQKCHNQGSIVDCSLPPLFQLFPTEVGYC